MEIIATINNGYLVSIDKIELEKLTGYYYNNREFEIGDNIKVDKLYDQLIALNDQAKEVKKMAHSLKTAAGMLEKINPVFQKNKE